MNNVLIDADKNMITFNGKTLVTGSLNDCFAMALMYIRWKVADHIDITKEGYTPAALVRKLKMCIIRDIGCSINGTEITKWEDLNPFNNATQSTRERLQNNEKHTEYLYTIAVHAPELVDYASKGTAVLEDYLDCYIDTYGKDYRFDRPGSAVTVDRLTHGKYLDKWGSVIEWHTTKDLTKEQYRETLMDKINIYISLHWYVMNGIEPDSDGIGRNDIDTYTGEPITDPVRVFNREEESIIVPQSACSLGLQMKMN